MLFIQNKSCIFAPKSINIIKNHIMRLTKLLIAIVLITMGFLPATAQETRKAFSAQNCLGIGFNADTNHPIFSGSLRLLWEMGKPSDMLAVNVGVGYRGFFDREPPREFLRNASISDYLFYSRENGETKNVRPVGGQIVLPAELQVRLFKLGKNVRLFMGCGAEYGIRLYQSHRYADYYGAHIMRANSLSVYPMLGVIGDSGDDVGISFGLYWRHFVKEPMNYKKLWDSEKFDAKDFFGFQLSLAVEL